MIKILKSNSGVFIVLVLIVVALILTKELPSCNRPAPKADTVVRTITRTITIHDTTHSKPVVLYKYINKTKVDTLTTNDCPTNTDCHFTVVTTDTLHTTYGTVATIDTLQDNNIIGRLWVPNLKIPEKETIKNITKQADPRRQLYFNYGVDGGYCLSADSLMKWSAGVVIGVTYKDRKDNMLTLNGSGNTDKQLRGQVIFSKKLSFKRNK